MTAHLPYRPDHTDPAVTAHHGNTAAFLSQIDTRHRSYEPETVAVVLHCTVCERSERSGPCFDQEEAIDLLGTLGWMENPAGSDVWYCPGCVEVRAVKDVLDVDDQLNEGRVRDNTAAAHDLTMRRHGRTR